MPAASASAVLPEIARLANIRLHPIKSLDPVYVREAGIGRNGSLELDRVWVLFTATGKLIDGKRFPAVHRIRAVFDEAVSQVTLSIAGSPAVGSVPLSDPGSARFAFPADYDRAAQWFSHCFGQAVTVRHIPESMPDDGLAPGPTILSTASLQTVCELFPGMPLEEARERFRATLEIDGVPAFWEDRLFGENDFSTVRFRIGEVRFEGSHPCARCPVPPRHPRSGEEFVGFQRAFTEMRRSALPAFSPVERFDHFYRFSTNTRVPSSETGKLLRAGDVLTFG
ncbi:MAG TPA: MOSC N-terminal beta barrel domain-containing protein [Dongiaceae bacterium]|nr:MOSC N-terminal beta barrel domain-containing protein [Dongiaceae bacterium]